MEARFFQCLSKWRPLYDISCQLRKEVSCWAVLDDETPITICGPAIGTKSKTEVIIPREVLQAKRTCYLIHTHPKVSPLSPPSVEDFQLLQQLKSNTISGTGLLLTSEGVYKFTTSDIVVKDVEDLQKILLDVCLAKKSLTDWYTSIRTYGWSFELHSWPEETEYKDLSGTDVLAIWRNRIANSSQMVM